MHQLIIILALVITPGLSLTYPIFGTQLLNPLPPVPIYQTVPQYYDNTNLNKNNNYEPFLSSQQSKFPIQNDNINNNNGYSNYFYYPSHEPQKYRTYGMPTYRGEYKPTPYYYAHGPTNYYDDLKFETPNPLDDLHEEMLQEDEREKERQLLPVGQETWFENIVRPSDNMANANAVFLRNLILYNKQLNAEKLRSEVPNIDEEVFDDYSENQDDMYDQQNDNYNINYNNNNNNDDNNNNNDNNNNYQQHAILHQHNNQNEDETVRELKSLANRNSMIKHSAYQSQPHQQQQKNHEQNQHQLHYNHHLQQDQPIDLHQSNLHRHHQVQPEHREWKQNGASYQQYDSDPEEDDSWIQWDKKRNGQMNIPKSIIRFSDRKPHIVDKTTTKTDKTFVTTTKPETINNENVINSGQKEIALLRPANPLRHTFSASALNIFKNSTENEKQLSNDKKDTSSKSSVYDTIKHLLAMDHNLEKNTNIEQSRLKKRYIASEETLLEQDLNRLKHIPA